MKAFSASSVFMIEVTCKIYSIACWSHVISDRLQDSEYKYIMTLKCYSRWIILLYTKVYLNDIQSRALGIN